MSRDTGFAETERSRLAAAEAAMPGISHTDLSPDLPADEMGRALWQQHQGASDDRPLYWQRLAILDSLIRAGASPEALTLFESASRGEPCFSADAAFKVLVTGFDPFHLDKAIDQSNPSGIVALQFADTRLDAPSAEIQTMVFPVRFADFDEGIVERQLDRLLAESGVDLIVTVSMGREQFDLERFPGRRRSSPNPDNANRHGGGSMADPFIPAGLESAPEFVEFSLPVAAMQTVGGPYRIRDNRAVTILSRGDVQADSLDGILHETAVQGSGGGYLSNEISYRMVLRCQGMGIPVGHIHTPKLQGYDSEVLATIVRQCGAMITAAVKSLG